MNEKNYSKGNWGWNESFNQAWKDELNKNNQDLIPARVISREHHIYNLGFPHDHGDICTGVRVTGAYEHQSTLPRDFPAVGDWVLVNPGESNIRIHGLLPRKTQLSRHGAGEETIEQVLAANISVLLLVFGLDGGRNFVPRLLERAMTVAWNSGARPVVVLNKADCADVLYLENALGEAENAAPGAEVFAVSASTHRGLEELIACFKPGDTLGMLGKSGVGKSALVNSLAEILGPNSGANDGGDRLTLARVGTQREKDLQGRHTTTSSKLFNLGSNIMIIDGPGLRELQIWGEAGDVDSVFAEIHGLSQECKFRDCSHSGEPGCAVQDALNRGYLDLQRFQAYLELKREQAYLERRLNQRMMNDEKLKWKQISKFTKELKKKI